MNGPALDVERLAGLVFELAAQLHAERLRRIALEHALETAGLLDPARLPELAGAVPVRERGRAAVEESVAALLRVICESEDPRAPLRGLAAGRGDPA